MYWFVCVTITQWISNKFQSDFPDTITNSPMQPIDIGTSWGSISLTIYYTLWGLGNIIVDVCSDSMIKYSNEIRVILCFTGFILYLCCHYFYDYNLRMLVVCLGLVGIQYDWTYIYKMEKKIK